MSVKAHSCHKLTLSIPFRISHIGIIFMPLNYHHLKVKEKLPQKKRFFKDNYMQISEKCFFPSDFWETKMFWH